MNTSPRNSAAILSLLACLAFGAANASAALFYSRGHGVRAASPPVHRGHSHSRVPAVVASQCATVVHPSGLRPQLQRRTTSFSSRLSFNLSPYHHSRSIGSYSRFSQRSYGFSSRSSSLPLPYNYGDCRVSYNYRPQSYRPATRVSHGYASASHRPSNFNAYRTGYRHSNTYVPRGYRSHTWSRRPSRSSFRQRHDDGMPKIAIIQIIGVIGENKVSSFDLAPAGIELNYQILDTPAWRQLNSGNTALAYAHFKKLAPESGNNGAAMVGYSLAAAFENNHNVAGYTMRQAFDNDPEGAGGVGFVIDDKLRKRIRQLAGKYQTMARQFGHNYADALFMHAALSSLIGDREIARNSIQEVISKGDRSDSSHNILQSLLPKIDTPLPASFDTPLLADISLKL
jgi:hypothetical protein